MLTDWGDLKEELRCLALGDGVTLFGVADLGAAREFVVRQGGAYLERFPRAVSICAPVPRGVVEGLADADDRGAAATYHYLIYEIVNRRLNAAALAVAARLEVAGAAAFVVPASQLLDKENLAGLVSHKLPAHLAGLGFIGRSCLFVTPRYGARVRLATVLTDAPLPADQPSTADCGDCQACVAACPPHAIAGVAFRSEDAREVRLKAAVCDRYMQHREQVTGYKVCGRCVLACAGQQARVGA
ncbi:MAG: epoxyqueuosine reductase [Chloroflexota bacterium]